MIHVTNQICHIMWKWSLLSSSSSLPLLSYVHSFSAFTHSSAWLLHRRLQPKWNAKQIYKVQAKDQPQNAVHRQEKKSKFLKTELFKILTFVTTLFFEINSHLPSILFFFLSCQLFNFSLCRFFAIWLRQLTTPLKEPQLRSISVF